MKLFKTKKCNFYSSKYNEFFYCLLIRYMVTRIKFRFCFKGFCLFGGAKLSKNADPNEYVYSGCGT